MPIKTHLIQIILLSVLPFVLGLNGCPTNKNFEEAVEQKKTCGSADPNDITNLLPGNCVGESTVTQQSIPQPSRQKPQSSSGQTIYITQLSFVDTCSYISIKPNENQWINSAVQRGIQTAVKNKSTFKFNSKGHTIQNTDTNFLSFLDTFYDPNKGKKDALQAVIKDIMTPNGADILVTGEYERKGKVVHVKPILLLKTQQSQLAKELKFNKSSFECIYEDIFGEQSKEMCSKAQREIENAVTYLLVHL